MSETKPDRFHAEIVGQPAAIRQALGAADQAARTIPELVRARPRSVCFVGMGSSHFVARPALRALGRAGVLAWNPLAAELLHDGLSIVTADDVVVFVSQSGETVETLRCAEELATRRRPPRTVAVTNGSDTPLRGLVDVALDTRVGAEEGPSTGTFAAATVALAGVARALAGPGPLEAAEVEGLAAAVEALLEPSAAADALALRETLVLLGRGGARAAAEMGALTIKEAAAVAAEALHSAQFRHGPLELADERLAAMIAVCDPPLRDLELGLAAELVDLGVEVHVIDTTTAPIGPLDPLLAPAAAVVPAQLLAHRLAVARGRTPGVFVRASKVTRRE